MIHKLVEAILSEEVSDETLYAVYKLCLTLTHTIKLNYGERLKRYCFQEHCQTIEEDCLHILDSMAACDEQPF